MRTKTPVTYQHLGWTLLILSVLFVFYSAGMMWTNWAMQPETAIAPPDPDLAYLQQNDKLCEVEEIIVQRMVDIDGWKCKAPRMTTDRLSPEGYWIGDIVPCWKLETPIKEYRVQECERTGDDYWCSTKNI